MRPEAIFSAPNLDTIYEVPLLFHKQQHHLASTCLGLLYLKNRKHKSINEWKEMAKRAVTCWDKKVRIAVVGKYFTTGDYKLVDSYVSVVEALRHASWKIGCGVDLEWIDSQSLEKGKENVEKVLDGFDGVVVPQGWGSRGTEGKLAAVEYAREHKIPYLGLCFGMQMATIEFARHVLNYKGANSTEVDPKTKYPIIHIMENQKKYLEEGQYGGTIRLGAWPCAIKKNTVLERAYLKYGLSKDSPWNIPNKFQVEKGLNTKVGNKLLVFERHRHRYEFNQKFSKQFEKMGFIISGTSPDGKLVEAMELLNHPFFVGTQFHPEYISRPLTPHPIFLAFIESMLIKKP